MKLCLSMAWQGQHSHVITASMFFPQKQKKLLSEFATEEKFGSWLISTRMGRVVPDELFAQAAWEQQQAVKPFADQTRAREAEELQMSSLCCTNGNLHSSVHTFHSCSILSRYVESQC